MTKRSIGIKAKIIISTLIPTIIIFAITFSILFAALFSAMQNTAKAEFSRLSEKYSTSFEGKISDAMDYLSFASSLLSFQVEAGNTDREKMQQELLEVFHNYGIIDGSSVYFEPNLYDGKDSQYVGTAYGTGLSGRICYYYYKDGESTVYLPEALENDEEFNMPHYLNAKNSNEIIYTKPAIHEIEGRSIAMFTITHPVRDSYGQFIGAVTVDIFLDEIFLSLQEEHIYETGYLIIANSEGDVIYSPRADDIGKTREEIGLNYDLPDLDETPVSFKAKSLINNKDILIAINSVYIPRLESAFYVSAAAPLEEINADGTGLMRIIVMCSLTALVAFFLLLYYISGRIVRPIREITESVNNIAGGDYQARITGHYTDEFANVKQSVNTMADSIEAYIEESRSSLNVLENILDGLDSFIYVTVPATGEILFINEQMKKHYEIPDNCIGEYCYKVLQEGIDERCEFCPCHELDKEPEKVVVWEEHSTRTKRYYRNTDCYIDWLGGYKVHLQHSVDITDIKSYMNDKLTAEREALEMANKKERAEETSRMKSEFLANMSHEIRTPMNAVIGMSELLLNEQLTARQQSYAKDIYNSSNSLLGIINDILDFSKIESGKLELIPVNYNLLVLIDTISSMFMFVAEKKGLEFSSEKAENLPECLYGDDIRLRQVLTNICGNAVKFTSKGSVRMSVAVSEDEEIVFKIEDTGMGIREEDIPKLFQAFSQADSQKNRSVKGTGLGLAISKSFIEMMGGHIKLDSVYGKGTTFTITIPIVLGDIDAIRKADEKDKKRTFTASSAKILVVDDNEVNLKVASGLLLLFGINAMTASSGAEAIDMVLKTDYDLVFMDHMMPEMDGVETVSRIRGIGERYERLTIIALTANAIQGAKEMFLANGFDGFLSKPIEISSLAEILIDRLPADKVKMNAEKLENADEALEQDFEKGGFLERLQGISCVNTEIGLNRVSGMTDMYQEAVTLFYKKLMSECEKMDGLLKSGDLHNFAVSVHGMKSSLSTIGAMELSGEAADLESYSKEGDASFCTQNFPSFAGGLRELHRQLSEVLPGAADTAPKREGSPEYLRENVQKALTAADDFDMDTSIEAIRLLLEYDFGAQTNELLEAADSALKDFDFDSAIEALNKISR